MTKHCLKIHAESDSAIESVFPYSLATNPQPLIPTLSYNYIFLWILDLTLRTAGEGDGERHDTDTPDEHSDHDDDFTGDIPLRRESHREADGTESGDSLEEGIVKSEEGRRR